MDYIKSPAVEYHTKPKPNVTPNKKGTVGTSYSTNKQNVFSRAVDALEKTSARSGRWDVVGWQSGTTQIVTKSLHRLYVLDESVL
eukprot:8552932-Pyramimonas_sp.AAC.1